MCRGAIPALCLAVLLIAACQAPAPSLRLDALSMARQLRENDAPRLFPEEYGSFVSILEHGENDCNRGSAEAEDAYRLAIQKAFLLKASLLTLKERLELEEKELQAAKTAEAEAKKKRLQREAVQAAQRFEEEQKRASESVRKNRATKEPSPSKPLPQSVTYYTVHRGETLPQIAAKSEIYNTSSLWPLIYRANRDQIRDPRQLWPGQVLKIPRNYSVDEAAEARRYSGKK